MQMMTAAAMQPASSLSSKAQVLTYYMYRMAYSVHALELKQIIQASHVAEYRINNLLVMIMPPVHGGQDGQTSKSSQLSV